VTVKELKHMLENADDNAINVQRYGAELIKKLVKERLGIELYYRSELD
jgi:hypothetical protein